jgi:hypothetical protein
MRIRVLLFAFLLLIVGVSGTAAVVQARSDGSDESFAKAGAAAEHTVTLQNQTDSRIWVGATVNADGSTPLAGLPTLDPGQSATITIPERSGAGHWRGKFFARQGCSGEEGSTFHCAVGDCGPFADRCSVGEQPASLAEFNFDTADALAPWYNVSYVNAVSVPITITPDGVAPPQNGGECAEMGCPGDLLSVCPPENLTKEQGTNKPLVCVNPNRDAKTAYSDAINKQCPKAYAWSKQDAEAGNQTVRQCSKCSGLTVAFHGTATAGAGNPNPVPTVVERKNDNNQSAAPHKGVALNPFPGTAQALTDSGSTWYHNWASTSGEVGKPAGTEFVPTIWGPGSVTDAELGNAAREGKNLLGFNEPDSPTQANLSPEQALDLWPRLQSTGLRMGAPAVATGADVPGGWLDRFMQGAAQRGLRVDFIPVHWYGADFGPAAAGQLADYLKRVHDRYQKPIWLTEYALIDWSQGAPRYPSEQEQAAFIQSSTTMLDGLDFVERYSWFALSTQTSPTGLYNGTSANASGNAYRAAH